MCVDGSGWAYAVNWTREWPPPRGSEHRGLCATRRRRWRRTRVHVGSSSAASDGSHSSTTSAAAVVDSHRWTGSIDGSAGGTDGTDARLVPLPLGCGGSGSGGDETVGLDLRLMNGVWGTDARGTDGGDLWPVRVGSLGLKNKACGFNAQGPWLASCARDDADVVDTGDGKTKRRFVVVVAEPDAEVTSAGGGDVLGREETAWKLTAHPPVSVQTALPCDCSYEIVDGKFILIPVWAIRMTLCFIYRIGRIDRFSSGHREGGRDGTDRGCESRVVPAPAPRSARPGDGCTARAMRRVCAPQRDARGWT